MAYSFIGRDYDDLFMVFRPEGSIGVGTANVENSEGWARVFQVTGTDNAKSMVTSSNVRSGLWAHNYGFYGAPAGAMTGTHSNQPFSVITNGSSKIIVLTNGYVGIGTIAPKELLSVNGKILANEIKVETAAWPDYVFQSDYDLKPLAEVEAFIKANGHLPEMLKAA